MNTMVLQDGVFAHDGQWFNSNYEWDDQAQYCKREYEDWKRSVVEHFIRPQLYPGCVYLEIGVGMGRWAKRIVDIPSILWLFDPNTALIDPINQIFEKQKDRVRFVNNNGVNLQGVPDESVDFVWSYDTFVHLPAPVVDNYLSEIYRVLKVGKEATLHYSTFAEPTGARMDLTALPQMAYRHRLYHMQTVDCWGEDGGYNCQVFKDKISTFKKR